MSLRPSAFRSLTVWWRAASVALALLSGLLCGPVVAADDVAPAAATTAASAAASPAPEATEVATVTILNRPIARLRAALPGVPPADRARRAQEEVRRVLAAGGPGVVSVVPFAAGKIVLIDDIGVFQLLPGDLTDGQTVDGVVQALQQVATELREARSVPLLLRATGFALLATAVFAGVVWLLRRMRSAMAAGLTRLGARHSQRIALGGAKLLTGERTLAMARTVTGVIFWLLLLVALEQWLGVVLRLFPYTRRWGERLNDSGMELAGQILTSVVEALPGLAVAIVIFFLARMLLRLFDPFFAQVQRGEMAVGWIDRYTVRATRGLVHIAVWLFALAMAYPYLPGAQTEAFKGISVVIGLMLSLGSSNVIGQAISGLIIIYSRTLHVGEYVRIGDVEGTVTETSTFAIRVRTGLGEELTLPNSLIVNQVTKNYSRAVKGEGYVVDTVMTIGYDTPWRQVHAMMIEGAKRTEGILVTPAPHVFQTALSDFYVEYRLVAQAIASAPRPRAQVVADLHAHLQDVFNENGVQIMSPHYLGDPGHAKVVPPAAWNPPLAGKG